MRVNYNQMDIIYELNREIIAEKLTRKSEVGKHKEDLLQSANGKKGKMMLQEAFVCA